MSCMLAVSCGGDDDDNQTITEQTINGCFEYVTNIAEGPSAYYSGLGYKIRLNYSEAYGDVTISGLKLTDGTSYPTFTLSGLEFGIDKNGWIVLTGSNIMSSIPGLASQPVFSRVSVRLYQRVVGSSYSPAFCISMTVDGLYSILSANPSQVSFGTTVSAASGLADFSTTDSQYYLTFNPDTRCVTITIEKAQFISSMPAMDIVLKNIPFSIIGGKAVFSAESIVPESNNTPYPAFPISDLKGEFDFGGDFDLEFNCAPAMFEGTVFHVTADCGFTPME